MTQSQGTASKETVRAEGDVPAIVPAADAAGAALDAADAALARLAAAIAAAGEREVQEALREAARHAPPEWTEEVILQSYLFAGFPRALNAAREWRRISGRPAPAHDEGARYDDVAHWRAEGERTCAVVYGDAYGRLRQNIRALHPALDAWMIVEGYGKVLSRAQLDLRRRELCIVAACAAAGYDRQLHAHLHGARNAGATSAQLAAVLDVAHDVVRHATTDASAPDQAARHRHLLDRVFPHDVH
jgi:4-carboxymuconolactone decarboxylase